MKLKFRDMAKTVREFYRQLNNDNTIPTIEGQGNFTADEMIWFAEQAVKIFAIPDVSNSVICECGNEMFKVIPHPYCCAKCGKRK